MAATAARIAIVGGGYTGAAAAVQLVRRRHGPLAITIVEPRAELGRGLAYSTVDPDHRLNAPADRHTVDPDEPLAFARWIETGPLAVADPAGRLPDGRWFARRHDFGRFVGDTLAAHAAMPDGTAIVHRRARAVAARHTPAGWTLALDDGSTLDATLLVLATGNAPSRLPGFVDPALASHPGVLAHPLEDERLAGGLPPAARVLVLGSGLTAMDAVATLMRAGHRGPLTMVSRRGLLPRPNPGPEELPLLAALAQGRGPFDAPGGPLPDWLAALGPAPGLRAVLRALRRRIAEDAARGHPWNAAFGPLRDAVWQLWPRLPEAERVRFLRHLKPWYDVHRFLSPPQTAAVVDAARRDGRLLHLAARVVQVGPAPQGPGLQARLADGRTVRADALLNCTGLDGGAPRDPLLRALQQAGVLVPGPAGLGWAVDETLAARDAAGRADPTLRIAGPPTLGACGDPIGAGYIANQLRRAVPAWLAALAPGVA